jgi:ribonuclease-3
VIDAPKKITETPQELTQRLNLQFADVHLLSRALTHRSYLNEHPDALEDNERLEFLGDAVLDFLVGEWLYNRFPEMEEGGLTQMRSAFVQTGQLANFAREIGLDNAIRLGRGELKSGGKLRNSLLCDVFEAVIGALLLDQGMDMVKRFIYPLLEGAVNEIITKRKNEDPKSMLQEWAQAKGFPPPKYLTINVSGPDHAKIFEVEARVNNRVVAVGEAMSKQAAEKSAAQKALDTIQKENHFYA